MPRYDVVYESLAKRAVAQAGLDIESFITQAINAGMSPSQVEAQLLLDLDEGGPVFGRFLRQLMGAAERSTAAAYRQGQRGGELEHSRHLRRLMRISNAEGSLLEQALDDADPAALAEVEQGLGPVVEYIWVAELKNTCHLCLPLHGQRLTLDEWQDKGLHPETIHPTSWGSACHCNLLPVIPDKGIEETAARVAPLKRSKVETVTGLKGSKKTRRAVTQKDIDKALEARDKAIESVEGRRTLRILGQSAARGSEDV